MDRDLDIEHSDAFFNMRRIFVVNGVGSGIFPCNSGCAGRTFSGILSFSLDIMC
jgi:hypothetical protein